MVPWVYFGVSLAGAASVVNAFFPFRREPLTVVSFALGWLVGELPIQTAVVQGALTAGFAWAGALHAWPGWLGLAVAVASWCGLGRLAVISHQTGHVVTTSLDGATGDPVPADGVDLTPAWNYWWRLAIAVPFRWRSIRRVKNIDYWGDDNYRHKLDVLHRRGGHPERGPVLLYVHGGAWMTGDKKQQGIPMMHELIERGWVCVAINYRLSPRATWPEHIVDCKRALVWVHEHIAEYGGDPDFVAVSGGSAGGHLCSLLALTPNQPEWQPGFEDADTTVQACVPYYGVYDLTGGPDASGAYGPGLGELLERRVFKTTMAARPELFRQASPTYRVTAAAPPMFVLHGLNDTLVPVTMARDFVARLRTVSRSTVAYVELPRAQHAFDVLASIRCRHTTMGSVRFLEAIRRRSGTGAATKAPRKTART
ncbi:MAG TPA: alpha/beta hydrolase [Acidimicrobiales bacterium]|nr:alpha/beta hydrolase [Acidimicrobiales bacterium]